MIPMQDTPTMIALLERWVANGWLRELDLALVRFCSEEVPDASAPLLLAIALVSHQLGRGHVCLDLATTLANPYMALSLPPEQEETPEAQAEAYPSDVLAGCTLPAWTAAITHPELVGHGEGRTPLVLVGHRLYLRRYWQYERQVEAGINQRMQHVYTLPPQFRTTLDALFPETGTTDWQKIACALSARHAFSIVTGGPGTGKTTTVVRLLALLQSIALAETSQPLHIRLAAPTGKAAARLKESIANAIDLLPSFVQDDPVLRESIPHEVTTLHRLLGPRADSRQFRHDARHPLALDVLVVDEGSMIDLEMMSAMLTALPEDARLILLGDKDQLASVEAGSVLGELCRRAQEGHFLPDTVSWIQQMTGQAIAPALEDNKGLPLDQHIVMLRESRRFHASSGIGQLANAVNMGDTTRIRQVWQHGYPDLFQHPLPQRDDKQLATILLGNHHGDTPQGLRHYLHVIKSAQPEITADKAAFDAWAAQVLTAHTRFQLLCVLRRGPYGVEGMNLRIEQLLREHHLIQMDNAWYTGRPVLVTRNDYHLGLMNGDIGITLPYPSHKTNTVEWTMRVAFNDGQGGIRWVLPSRLTSAETVFALTVHKSQGSEFDHCALLLPPETNPVMTRELVYTGITRARKWFSLISIANPRILEETVARTVQRSGGLFL